ncbi:MAG: SMP-30/gluconolactonase/LRE family protein [Pseudomonadota bacterium]
MDFESVAEGLQFPEGPVAMADGSVIVVEIRRGTLTRIPPDGSTEIIADMGGGPNGAAIGPDGAMYVCNNGGFEYHDVEGLCIPGHAPADYETGRIERVDLATGEVTRLYDNCEGRPLRGPNDIVFDAHGGFYFTDLGKSWPRKRDTGAVYYALPDGSKIVEIEHSLVTPNGCGLSSDGKYLYYADTVPGRLWEYEILAPGEVAMRTPLGGLKAQLVTTLPGLQYLDSLAVTAAGNICVATILNGGVSSITPGGEVTHYATGDPLTTNICFGGEDMRDAWITASGTGKLLKARWPEPGLKLNFNA